LQVSISFPTPSGNDFYFTLDPLYASIDTSKSTFSVMPTKVEVVLFKHQPGQKWPALEMTLPDGSKENAKAQNVTASGVTVAPTTSSVGDPMKPAQPISASTQQAAPAYPTSSRHGAKDWDKLASSLTAKKKSKSSKNKGEESSAGGQSSKDQADADAGSESDAASIDSDYGTGDPVDSFFKKLYANADPDTRRAMMKSYYESEGTALSTNWGEVGKGKVDVRPPKGD
jgi:suppressor of G2 allele of SKP1